MQATGTPSSTATHGAGLPLCSGCSRTQAPATSSLPSCQSSSTFARPPKSDGWHFSNAAHANVWLQKQRAFVAALPAEGQPALLDLGRVAADNAGVRCDGMHFAKNWERGIMAKVKCATSAAAYDEALLGALRTHCGCKGAADAAGDARERKRR